MGPSAALYPTITYRYICRIIIALIIAPADRCLAGSWAAYHVPTRNLKINRKCLAVKRVFSRAATIYSGRTLAARRTCAFMIWRVETRWLVEVAIYTAIGRLKIAKRVKISRSMLYNMSRGAGWAGKGLCYSLLYSRLDFLCASLGLCLRCFFFFFFSYLGVCSCARGSSCGGADPPRRRKRKSTTQTWRVGIVLEPALY
jgi:hypothetical protein